MGEAMTEKSKQDEALDGIDESKRRTLMRLGLGRGLRDAHRRFIFDGWI